MNKNLKRIEINELYYYLVNGKKIYGSNPSMSGDCSGLYGDCSRISGCCSGLYGNCSGLYGDCSRISGCCSGLSGNWSNIHGSCTGLCGDFDKCNITVEERVGGLNTEDLIGEL